jgi:hypothetical protein
MPQEQTPTDVRCPECTAPQFLIAHPDRDGNPRRQSLRCVHYLRCPIAHDELDGAR